MTTRPTSRIVTRFGLTTALLLGSFALPPAHGQGRDNYFNVESIQCSPITTATIKGHTYILACNTPDNSLEIWDTDENKPADQRFLRRIPVGLEPVSVIWDAARTRFTVASFLSDSITSGVLRADSGPASLFTLVDKIQNVGDEPIDLTLTPDGSKLLVTFNGASTVGAFHPVTLAPVPSSLAFPAPTDNLLLEDTSTSPDRVIKEPHAVATRGDRMFVLGFKGGTGNGTLFGSTGYDFDLYTRSLVDGSVIGTGGLGSINWNMSFASGGDLYVVGGMAQNQLTGSAVASAPTGFVTTNLYRVTGAETAAPVVFDRDLNMNSAGNPVSKAEALTMATDVAVYEPTLGVSKVFVAAFGSDRVGALSNTTAANPLNWSVARIDIPVAAGSLSARTGPRGLTLKPATGSLLDPGDRLYVLNRLDNSIAIINPVNDTHLETFKLQSDPTPDHIVIGREFLFSAEHSGSGFVSCSSCHLDGRTDAVSWNLGEPGGFSTAFGREFVDSPSLTTLSNLMSLLFNGFDPDKGPIITQTFQGLLNYDVEPISQKSVTNAPYHWRGDRSDFTKFNEGFANLLALGNLFGTAQAPAGIPLSDMLAFEQYVNSINYPPNPKQPETRVYSGSIGNFNDRTSGSGAQRGMKSFHIRPLLSQGTNGRSCVQCHSLPVGSNSKYTDSFAGIAPTPQPLETAQVRGLFQREALHQVDGFDTAGPIKFSGMFGLTHAGGRRSINAFVNLFGGPQDETEVVSQYMHEFDFGAGPMIGQVATVTAKNPAVGAARMKDFEAQARLANNGVAIIGQVGSVALDYWFDPVSDLYVQDSTGNTVNHTALVGMVTGTRDRLFAICTPLGNTRRVANTNGNALPLTGPPPANLDLEPLAPNTANVLIPNLTLNWVPAAQGGTFNWNHNDPQMPTPRFPRAVRQFQYGLLQASGNYGLSALRHDAPRRLRISGDQILEGAKLHLYSPADTSGAPPNTANSPDPAKTVKLTFDIFPTAVSSGTPIWETAVELAPIAYYALMNGGQEAPGVADAFDDVLSQLPEPPTAGTFDPDNFNFHFIEVENPDGTITAGGWHPLTLAP